MVVGQGRDWKAVLGDAAVEAGRRSDLDALLFSAGFDGGAYVWSWRVPDNDGPFREVSLRATPDPLEAGIETRIVALARRRSLPFLAWSAATWTRHLAAEEPADGGSPTLDGGEILSFEETLPLKLREAFDKVEAIAPRLEELDRRRERHSDALEGVRHLIAEGRPRPDALP